MTKLITIAKNTLTETLRQTIYAILIGCAILLYILSPSLTMYTLDDDNKLDLIDPARLLEVEARVRDLAPAEAPLVRSVRGEVAPDTSCHRSTS